MNILHISSSHENDKQHAFSYHFKEGCKKLGHNIKSLSPFRDNIIIPYMKEEEDFKSLYSGQQIFPLSRVLDNHFPEADFIFLENPKFFFNNDVNIPVFYYHRDLKNAIYVKNPTHLGLRFWSLIRAKDGRPKGGHPELIELYHPEIWWNNDIKKVWLCHAISQDEFGKLNRYKDLERNKKGIAYYGSYKSVRRMMYNNNYTYEIYHKHREIIDYIEKWDLALGFRHVNEELDDYKKHLFEFDATVIIPGWSSWETRRLYEASYCDCVPILYIEDDNARAVFGKQGYIDGETCITFTKKHKLMRLNIYNYDLDYIRKKGRDLVVKRHTYEVRIKELIKTLNI